MPRFVAGQQTGPAPPGAGILTAIALLAVAAGARSQPEAPDRILSAVVGVRAEIPANARTARSLGQRRSGSGVVIDGEGLVLTVGYLVMESERVFVAPRPGEEPEVPARFVAYDHASGFGLVRAEGPLDVTPMPLGDSDEVAVGAPVMVASYGGRDAARPALLADRRPFAGYWEYLLDDALLVAPPHPLFGGAALISPAGELLGIGSLIVDDARLGDTPLPGNLFIPVNRLKPVLGELLARGRGPDPQPPWLFVRRVAEDGPAARAGVPVGAIIAAVDGEPVRTLEGFLRHVWGRGGPGVTVRLTLLVPDGSMTEVDVISEDRHRYLLDPRR